MGRDDGRQDDDVIRAIAVLLRKIDGAPRATLERRAAKGAYITLLIGRHHLILANDDEIAAALLKQAPRA